MSRHLHRWPLWHYAGLGMGTAMSIVPRRFRFSAAVSLARVMSRLIGQTDMYRRTQQSVETLEENTLSHVLNMMTRRGTLFDPEFELVGLADLEHAIARGQGVFIAAMHAALNTLVIRQLNDIGCRAQIIAVDTGMLIPGTRQLSAISAPADGFMLRLRTRLRAGGVACAMVDRADPGRRTIAVATPAGPLIVANALFRVAERANAVVLFVHVRVLGGKVQMTFSKATEDGGAASADTATLQFAKFMQLNVPQPV